MTEHKPGAVARRKRRLVAVLVVAALTAGVVGRPVFHITRAAIVDRWRAESTPAGFVDDASRLDRTRVAEVIQTATDSVAAEAQLAELFRRAATEKIPVAIAGARHTMGGHTIARGGITVDMTTFRGMTLSPDSATLRVRAGTRWAEVIPYLDSYGRSLAVMQSNNNFTVGGSLSANAHGWQHDHAPMASSVLSMRVMTPDGTIRRTSRTENRELFSLVLGGYGLFGIILDAELRTVPNERYAMERFETTSARYAELFDREVRGGGARTSEVGMAYGRLSVAPSAFLREATLTVFRRTAGSTPHLSRPALLGVKRAVFRGSAGSAYGKELRWTLEKRLGELPGASIMSRNQLLNEPAEFFANTSEHSTDVLHEYFIPEHRMEEFLVAIRPVISARRGNLLNVTIRNVLPDTDTFLPYARERVFGLVMLFTQGRTPAAEDSMRVMTRELVDAALQVEGTYYLPYRLHATPAQFQRAYPMAPAFLDLKTKYDSGRILQNTFYRTYGDSVRPPQ